MMVSTSLRLMLAVALLSTTHAADDFGTLVTCADGRCLWAAADGALVPASTLQARFLEVFLPSASIEQREAAARRLATHMQRMETTRRTADARGHAWTYKMGVTARHLTAEWAVDDAAAFVQREIDLARDRRQLQVVRNASTSDGSMNWCSTNNPLGRSVCSAVKSQANCGSCWAFAATDAIESAVALATNSSSAPVLSVQQFLSCSRRDTEDSFTYCWARNRPDLVTSAPWLSESIRWKSENNVCDGGMTHGAFMDAAQLHFGLLPEIAMPYVDYDGENATTPACIRSSERSIASITNWAQVAGPDCSTSSDPSTLLKAALATQPIAVAINAEGYFKDYKGGVYTCPDNGDLPVKDMVNHALVLVGYGTDTQGDYWILKNSYGSSWGDKGFMQLRADTKLNCGLNIFPVVPLGASASANGTMIVVDGGGDDRMLGLTEANWIMLAIVVSGITIILTVIGIFVSLQRRKALREGTSGSALTEQMLS